jgi:hypothetical protein
MLAKLLDTEGLDIPVVLTAGDIIGFVLVGLILVAVVLLLIGQVFAWLIKATESKDPQQAPEPKKKYGPAEPCTSGRHHNKNEGAQ